MDVEYLPPDTIAKVVAETVNAPPIVVARFKQALELK
jgi:hypothetical protein